MEPGLCGLGLASDLAFGQPQAVSLLQNPPTSSVHRNYRLLILPTPFLLENLPCLVKESSQSVSSRLRSRCGTDFCLQMTLCSFFTPQPLSMYAAARHQQR
jgi:hypothetical protein